MIDREVLEVQRDVLRDARELHEITLAEAVALEVRAQVAERDAHAEVERARKRQADQRRYLADIAADLAAIDDVLRLIPGQRKPSTGS